MFIEDIDIIGSSKGYMYLDLGIGDMLEEERMPRKRVYLEHENEKYVNCGRKRRIECKEDIATEMLQGDWVTDPHQGHFIGHRVRKYHEGYGMINGIIEAYLPSSENAGDELWHVRHDDGDSEDFSENEMIASKAMYDNDENTRVGSRYQVSEDCIPQPVERDQDALSCLGHGERTVVDTSQTFDAFRSHVKLLSLSVSGTLVVARYRDEAVLRQYIPVRDAPVTAPRSAVVTARVGCVISVSRPNLSSPDQGSATKCVVFDGSTHHLLPLSEVSFPLDLCHPEEMLMDLWTSSPLASLRGEGRLDERLSQDRSMQPPAEAPLPPPSPADIVQWAEWAYAEVSQNTRPSPSSAEVAALLSSYVDTGGDLWEMWWAQRGAKSSQADSPSMPTDTPTDCPGPASAQTQASPTKNSSDTAVKAWSSVSQHSPASGGLATFRDACFWYPLLRPSLGATKAPTIHDSLRVVLAVFQCADVLRCVGQAEAACTAPGGASMCSTRTQDHGVDVDTEAAGWWGSASDGTDDLYILRPARLRHRRRRERHSSSSRTQDTTSVTPPSSQVPLSEPSEQQLQHHQYRRKYYMNDARVTAPSDQPHYNSKAVEQVDLVTGNVMAVYQSGKAAAAAMNMSSVTISTWCHSQRKFRDHYWRFQQRAHAKNRGSQRRGKGSDMSVGEREDSDASSWSEAGDLGGAWGEGEKQRVESSTGGGGEEMKSCFTNGAVDSGSEDDSRGGVCEAKHSPPALEPSYPSPLRHSLVNGLEPRHDCSQYLPLARRTKRGRRGVTVECLDADSGQVVEVFSSCTEAALRTGVSAVQITQCYRGERRRVGKYTFRRKTPKALASAPDDTVVPEAALPLWPLAECSTGNGTASGSANSGVYLESEDERRLAALVELSLSSPFSLSHSLVNGLEPRHDCSQYLPLARRTKRGRRGVTVECLDADSGQVVEVFSSCTEAALRTGVSAVQITQCYRGERRRVGKYTFRRQTVGLQ